MSKTANEWLTDERIREVFLANGFTVKEGETDLKPYVFQAARALIGEFIMKCPVPDYLDLSGPPILDVLNEGASRDWELLGKNIIIGILRKDYIALYADAAQDAFIRGASLGEGHYNPFKDET